MTLTEETFNDTGAWLTANAATVSHPDDPFPFNHPPGAVCQSLGKKGSCNVLTGEPTTRYAVKIRVQRFWGWHVINR